MTSVRHTSHSGTSVAEEDVLDAARDVILAVGWSRATLTEVARRARVSRMTIYRSWPDTQSLLADLLTRELAQTIGAAGISEADSPAGLVDGVVSGIRALRSSPLLGRITDLDPSLLLPYLLQRPGRSQELVVTELAKAIRSGQRSGTIRRGSPQTMARSVVLAAHGFTLSAHTMLGAAPRGADVRRFDRELRRMLLGYLSP